MEGACAERNPLPNPEHKMLILAFKSVKRSFIPFSALTPQAGHPESLPHD
jgi:hypothetical protein